MKLTMEMLSPAKLPAKLETQPAFSVHIRSDLMNMFGSQTYFTEVKPEAQAALPEIQNTPRTKAIRKSCQAENQIAEDFGMDWNAITYNQWDCLVVLKNVIKK